MISREVLKEYMLTVVDEIENIPVEVGSNKQSFKTMIKQTSRLRYVKHHLVVQLKNNSTAEEYKILYDSMKCDEAFINICRGVLGLEPKDFD